MLVDPISASARKIQPITVPYVLEVAPECNGIMNTSRLMSFFKNSLGALNVMTM